MKKISSNPSEPDSRGYLTRLPLPLLLLLISLGLLFVLLVTIQVHVLRVHQSSKNETRGLQQSHQSVSVPWDQLLLELQEIHQELTCLNASLDDASLCRPCSWNWDYFQRSCYFFSLVQRTWNASVSACQHQGAHLVIINNVEEQNFLQFWTAKKDTSSWIGLNDYQKENEWHWVDNTSLQLGFWVKGEPNNSGDEDCVELIPTGWNDNICTKRNSWICEKPSTPCTGL